MGNRLPAEQELFAHVRMLEHAFGTLLAMQLAKAPDLISARFKAELMLTYPQGTDEKTAAVSERIGELLKTFLDRVAAIERGYRDSAVSLQATDAPGGVQ